MNLAFDEFEFNHLVLFRSIENSINYVSFFADLRSWAFGGFKSQKWVIITVVTLAVVRIVLAVSGIKLVHHVGKNSTGITWQPTKVGEWFPTLLLHDLGAGIQSGRGKSTDRSTISTKIGSGWGALPLLIRGYCTGLSRLLRSSSSQIFLNFPWCYLKFLGWVLWGKSTEITIFLDCLLKMILALRLYIFLWSRSSSN